MESIPLDESLAGIEHSVERLIAQVRMERATMQHLLKQIGSPALCKGCRQAIRWVRHLNGKQAPYDLDGTSHWGTCPKAKEFYRHGK